MDRLTQQQIEAIVERKVLAILGTFVGQHAHIFEKNIQMLDGVSVQAGNNRGLKIGTAPTQKIGLYGTTPVAKQTSITALPGSNSAEIAINNLITTLRNIGIIS
jgi:hypothetical protein